MTNKKSQGKNISQMAKARDKSYRVKQSLLEKLGVYAPIKHEITRHKKTTINKKLKEIQPFLNDKFFFVKAPKAQKSTRKTVLERAKSLEIKTTKKGFFFERDGHTAAKLVYDRHTKEYHLERQGKTKRGPNAGREYKSTIPLAPLDAMDKERARLMRMAHKNPLKSDKERYAFKVVENGIEGYSRRTFSKIEDLFAYLDTYKKKTAAKVNFFRHIEIEHVKSSDAFFKAHPGKRKGSGLKVNAKGRNV